MFGISVFPFLLFNILLFNILFRIVRIEWNIYIGIILVYYYLLYLCILGLIYIIYVGIILDTLE